ncbi:MAG: copper resistance CopC family protein [Sphingomonas sp.]
MDARILAVAIGASSALLVDCAAPGARISPAQQAAASVLVRSSPRAGSTVAAPIDNLRLHFNPPARLDEVTISGPEGVMPTMIHAAGELRDYVVPLSGLGPGVYSVAWRAMSAGREQRGRFVFSVK